MADELYDIRNSLLVGNFHQVISDGSTIRTAKKKPEELAAFNAERDALVLRAQLGLGQFDAVISELATTTTPLLLAVRRLAELHKELVSLPVGAGATSSTKLSPLVEMANPANNAATAEIALLACAGYFLAQDVAGAMSLASQWITKVDANATPRVAIELRGIMADGYLRLSRADLADKEVQAMKAIDDESSLAILLAGIVALRQGALKQEKLNEAMTAFLEINSRCGQSVAVLNMMALTNLSLGKARDAERNLLDALSKRSGDPDVVANLAVVAAQLGKPTEATLKYLNQAKSTVPPSPWARQLTAMEKRFKEAAAN